jgi:S1-C subfamily serine protease
VLGHIRGIDAVILEKSKLLNNLGATGTEPFASLAISTAAPRAGRFVVVSGFPLGSWTPALQIGMIAATKTINPNAMYGATIHKDGGELLQISISANHGNSGGPVIDLNSGQVIGVVDQVVPAPLQIGGQHILNPNTFSASGIMLAAPAKWVEALLEKNHIKSEGVPAGKLVAF